MANHWSQHPEQQASHKVTVQALRAHNSAAKASHNFIVPADMTRCQPSSFTVERASVQCVWGQITDLQTHAEVCTIDSEFSSYVCWQLRRLRRRRQTRQRCLWLHKSSVEEMLVPRYELEIRFHPGKQTEKTIALLVFPPLPCNDC